MRIQTNISAMTALRNVGITEQAQGRAIEKLSSGFRLNRAGDDAAGMSIANSLRSNARGLSQAQKNASQAGSFLQVADGAVQTLSTMLDRMRELATEAASDNVTTQDRQKIGQEFTQLQSEWDRIVNTTQYQGQSLLNGTFGITDTGTLHTTAGVGNVSITGAAASTTYTITQSGTSVTLSGNNTTQTITIGAGGANQTQTMSFDKLGISFSFTGDATTGNPLNNATVFTGDATTGDPLNNATVVTGASTSAGFRVGGGTGGMGSDDVIQVGLSDLRASTVGIDSGSINVLNATSASSALAAIDTALGTVNSAIGTIGAAQNRLDYATANVNSLYQNVTAAESVIRDADMAQEYTNYSKLQILQQAGTAMLAQANSSSQSVLQLLRG